MATEETRALVDEYYARLTTGDRAGVRALLADDCVWVPPPNTPLREVVGNAAVTDELGGKAVKRTFDLSKPFSADIQRVVVDGDVAVVMQRITGTAKATGQRYENQYFWVYTVHDGKIARMEEYTDTILATRAFAWDEVTPRD